MYDYKGAGVGVAMYNTDAVSHDQLTKQNKANDEGSDRRIEATQRNVT